MAILILKEIRRSLKVMLFVEKMSTLIRAKQAKMENPIQVFRGTGVSASAHVRIGNKQIVISWSS